MAMDSKTALGLLPELRSNGLLTRLSPPRSPVTSLAKEGTHPQVTLPTGKEVDGERVKAVAPSLAPRWYSVSDKIVVELIIGSDGIARQPILLSPGAQPLQVFLHFAFLRQWHFSPAKVAGEPTTTAYVIVVNR